MNESVSNSKQKWSDDECRWECKELDDCSLCKDKYMWNPSTSDRECNKVCKIDLNFQIHIYILKIVPVKKCLFGKLVLACEDEILNTTETALVENKKWHVKKIMPSSHYFIGNYMLIIISCHFH